VNCLVTGLSSSDFFLCTNAEISNRYFTIITPPGWAFSIWGLIFVWEAIACIYAVIPKFAETSSLVVDRTFVLCWAAACLAQCAWTFAFCTSLETAAALLFAVWLALAAQQQTTLRKLAALGDEVTLGTKFQLYVLLVAPFSLHLGWITAATALNVNMIAVKALASAETQLFMAVASLLFAALVGWTFGVTGVSWSRSVPDVAAAGGIIWALFAISKHETLRGLPMPALVTGALSSAATFAASMLLAFVVIRHVISGAALAQERTAVADAKNAPEEMEVTTV
jgi:hypothetical protein